MFENHVVHFHSLSQRINLWPARGSVSGAKFDIDQCRIRSASCSVLRAELQMISDGWSDMRLILTGFRFSIKQWVWCANVDVVFDMYP